MQYVSGLTQEQRENFLKALAFVIYADGEVNGEEKDFLEVAAQAYGVSPSKVVEILQDRDIETVKALVQEIDDIRARRYLVREMISLGLCDGELSDDELDAIFSIGESLDITEERMDDMVSWAIEGLEWQLDGFRLIEEDE